MNNAIPPCTGGIASGAGRLQGAEYRVKAGTGDDMTTYERLKEVMIKEYDVPSEKLDPSARLEDLGIDSLGVMELMFKIEEVFEVRLPAEEAELHTVQDVVSYIERLFAEQPAAASDPA
jgi:acyl carrier protein